MKFDWVKTALTKIERKWLILFLAPFLYFSAYFAYRQTHCYESPYSEENLKGDPKWFINFDLSPFGRICDVVFGPTATMEMYLNDLGLSYRLGDEFVRDGVWLCHIKRRSTSHDSFQTTVEQLIEANGEVLAVFQFPTPNDDKSYEFFDSPDAFAQRLSELAPSTGVVVKANRQLPIRGQVDEAFIARARTEIADGDDWVINDITANPNSWYQGATHTQLESQLRAEVCFGKVVALGPQPDFHAATGLGDISGIVPNKDGSVTVYRSTPSNEILPPPVFDSPVFE